MDVSDLDSLVRANDELMLLSSALQQKSADLDQREHGLSEDLELRQQAWEERFAEEVQRCEDELLDERARSDRAVAETKELRSLIRTSRRQGADLRSRIARLEADNESLSSQLQRSERHVARLSRELETERAKARVSEWRKSKGAESSVRNTRGALGDERRRLRGRAGRKLQPSLRSSAELTTESAEFQTMWAETLKLMDGLAQLSSGSAPISPSPVGLAQALLPGLCILLSNGVPALRPTDVTAQLRLLEIGWRCLGGAGNAHKVAQRPPSSLLTILARRFADALYGTRTRSSSITQGDAAAASALAVAVRSADQVEASDSVLLGSIASESDFASQLPREALSGSPPRPVVGRSRMGATTRSASHGISPLVASGDLNIRMLASFVVLQHGGTHGTRGSAPDLNRYLIVLRRLRQDLVHGGDDARAVFLRYDGVNVLLPLLRLAPLSAWRVPMEQAAGSLLAMAQEGAHSSALRRAVASAPQLHEVCEIVFSSIATRFGQVVGGSLGPATSPVSAPSSSKAPFVNVSVAGNANESHTSTGPDHELSGLIEAGGVLSLLLQQLSSAPSTSARFRSVLQKSDLLGKLKECLIALGVSPTQRVRSTATTLPTPELRFFALNAHAIVGSFL